MLLAVSAYWPVGASFRYVSKCGFASRRITGVHHRHAEPVVRFGHVRIELDGLLELRLRLRNLAGVPEDDSLVERGRGGGAAAGRRPRAGAPISFIACALASAARSNFFSRVVDGGRGRYTPRRSPA